MKRTRQDALSQQDEANVDQERSQPKRQRMWDCKRRTTSVYNQEQMIQRVQAEIESISNDLKRRVQEEQGSASWNKRQHLLLVLRLGRQYKREHVMFDSHILPFLVRYMKQEGLLKDFTTPSSAAAHIELADYIESVNMQEKSDQILNKAYVCTMKQTQDSLREAERLLLSILPDSVGGEVLDVWFEEGAFTSSSSSSTTQYYDVEQPLELSVLQEQLKEEQVDAAPTLFPCPITHHSALHLFVYLLIEQREFERAIEVCQVALKRNPLFVHCLFETGEIYKMLKKPEELYHVTMQCFQRCYKQKDIAKCYRNFGFYYIELKKYELSVACFLKSLEYEVHNMVKNELNYIQQRLPQNDKLYVAIQTIVGNLVLIEQEAIAARQNSVNGQQQQQQVIQTVQLLPDIQMCIKETLEQAKIPINPNPIFLQLCHRMAVLHRGSQKRFLEACTLAYGITLNSSYLAYMKTYLQGAEICGHSVAKDQGAAQAKSGAINGASSSNNNTSTDAKSGVELKSSSSVSSSLKCKESVEQGNEQEGLCNASASAVSQDEVQLLR